MSRPTTEIAIPPAIGVTWTAAEVKELEDLQAREDLLPPDAPRALLSIRLSVLTEETTSPVRQELDLRRMALDRRCRVAGVARDLNVSATKVPPWKRKALGDWIQNRAPEFDVILFWKLDRFVRRISDLHLMIEWCKTFKKDLAAVKDPIDLSSPMGEMMVTMIAGMARIEAANTGIRLESLWQYARTVERWVIGRIIYGYASEDTPDGKRLVVDSFKYRVLHWIKAMLQRRRALNNICIILNRAQVPSPGGGKWAPGNLKNVLTNPALMGYRTRREPGMPTNQPPFILYGPDGEPIRVAPGVFTPAEFSEVQELLRLRAKNTGGKPTAGRSKRTKFLGVIKCGFCGAVENMYQHITKKKRKDGTYRISGNKMRCQSATKLGICGGPTFDPEDTYGALTSTVLDQIGAMEVIHREYARGSENLMKKKELEASIKYHMKELAPGGSYSVGGFIESEARRTLASIGDQLSRIDPVSLEDRWIYASKGVTYQQHWEREGLHQMESDLIRAGITFVMYEDRAELLIPEDVKQRLVVKDDYFKKRV
ncbi:recombinase family protein [Streptomyces uncialis]|uniref:Recombinase domain-containing protein n=1 Tax=Streptomyces uncialis TaxID=1048205 RepID=A0A1Q4VC80_9ACTN|nr:recombinase family protein [Streptomyces uncialis]OKH95438.1 hypothetical protein AB852_00840 [Streptomyces uncialis]